MRFIRRFGAWFGSLHASCKLSIVCISIFVVAAHVCVWTASWPNNSGATISNLLGVWILVSGMIGIFSLMYYVLEVKDGY